MHPTSRLPVPLQLGVLTAVIAVVVAFVQIFFLVRFLRTSGSAISPTLLPPGFYPTLNFRVILIAASCGVIFACVARPARVATRILFAYCAALIGIMIWSVYSEFQTVIDRAIPNETSDFYLRVVPRLLIIVWLGAIGLKLLSSWVGERRNGR
jgi:hypothetical protein